MRRKFVVTFENHSYFKSDKYDHRKLTKEAHFVFHPMNTILREESINEVHVSRVYLQDKYYSAGNLTEESEEMIGIE